MAIIMLALGALLAVVGLYALVTGYPMIEIERGWATVISGAVLLSGGLIIVALGIVVRTLTGLKAELAAGAPVGLPASPRFEPVGYEPTLSAPGPTERHASVADETPPPLPATVSGDSVPVLAAAALAAGRGERASIGLPRAADFDGFDMPARVAPDAEPEGLKADIEPQPETEPAESAWHDQGFSAFDLEPEAVPPPPVEPEPRLAAAHIDEPHVDETRVDETHVDEPHVDQPHVDTSHVDETEVLDPPIEESSPSVPRMEPVPAPLFASPPFLRRPAAREPAPEPKAREDQVPEDPAPEHPAAEHPTAEPPADAPLTAPESLPSNLAVIGRYDSEGTSYVMYADGSIEAQSESGVFRFGSMAELKAFIEG